MAFNFFGASPTTVSMEHFSPRGMCDLSSQIFLHKDLVPVMEWAGDTLYDTGLLAYKDYVDAPNPFFRTPPVFMDPRPQMNARPYGELKIAPPNPDYGNT